MGRFLGSGMILAKYPPRSCKRVLTELSSCFDLTQHTEGGGEIVHDVYGEGALITEDPPRPGESVLGEIPGCLNLAKHLKVAGQLVRAV
jgi:hypothetical protein